MKLVTYEQNGAVRAGAVVDGDRVVDVSAAGDVLRIMTDPAAQRRAMELLGDPQTARFALSDLRLRAPLVPRSLICIGLNYMDHCRETGAAVPTRPVIFAKFANALADPGDTITWYADTTREVDYEAELGVVIGKPCYRVSEAEALQYVGGYTCVNDISARDVQLTDGGKQWTLGKTLDGFCPIGPALVTADDIPDPQTLSIRCVLNGQVVQHSNTKEMIFSCAVLIAHLSRFMTLQPGDLISTGTPFGVGMSREPKLWLKDGDVVVVEIEKIGALENRVRVVESH
ncbi:MAG: fumarylacetoacetate hydrolase family protein [Anaerolineae bacterium]|nr:fumarylacetoacetate hydrolase family protein [Thermoflexales bacterium]MDW8406782.1 fumarylacetoacetate hydrolase family protein [Anaerolineae bacterium]